MTLETKVSFSVWWQRLCHIADECGWELGEEDKDSYREYYDDGDEPEDVIDTEMSYARECN